MPCYPNPRATALYPFFHRTTDREPLFAVRSGVPLEGALEAAAGILDSARDAAETAGLSAKADATAIWATFYLVDMALAVVNSAILASRGPQA